MKSLISLTALLVGLLTPVLAQVERIQSPLLPHPLGLEVGGDASRKPSDPPPDHPDNPSPTPPSNPPPDSSPFSPDLPTPFDSDGCCDCRYECLGLGHTENPIDFGDSTPTTISSWNTSPFNTDGCNGHSYTAFNLYGIGYGRWGYDHSDIHFYLTNQYDDPTGKYVIQFDNPVVDSTKTFGDFGYGQQLFEAFVIDATSYKVLDSCPCFNRKGYSTWECDDPYAFRCCVGGLCHERLNFQCGPCGILK